MTRRRVRFGAAGLCTIVLAGATAAASLAGGPTITLVQGQSAPYVTGSGFTPGGAVRFKEFQLGTKKPIWTAVITADGFGNFAQFGQCDGANEIAFRAIDNVTGVRSNRTKFQVYTCIG